jgi:hypothetical protein
MAPTWAGMPGRERLGGNVWAWAGTLWRGCLGADGSRLDENASRLSGDGSRLGGNGSRLGGNGSRLGADSWGLGPDSWGLSPNDWGLGPNDWGLGPDDWGLGPDSWGIGPGGDGFRPRWLLKVHPDRSPLFTVVLIRRALINSSRGFPLHYIRGQCAFIWGSFKKCDFW